MTARDWTALAFRLVGIYLILLNLIQIPAAIAALQNAGAVIDPGIITWVWLVAAVLLPVVVGVQMLRRTDWFVDKAFASVLKGRAESDADEEEGDAPLDAPETLENTTDEEWVTDFSEIGRDDIHAIAFSIMGIWILSDALPVAANYLAEFFRYQPDDVTGNFLDVFISLNSYGLVFVMTRVALGLWLFFRSSSITRLWSRSQNPTPKQRITG